MSDEDIDYFVGFAVFAFIMALPVILAVCAG